MTRRSRILPKPNGSAYMLIGNDSVTGKGPSATGSEHFVFLAFGNSAAKGKLNPARSARSPWD